MQLSEEQKKIVEAQDGNILVKASAGSGKTRVITERIKHLYSHNRVKRKILAITFTNKAAKEMEERLKNIPETGERFFINTFHGFCKYALENHGKMIGLSGMPHIFEEEADRRKLIEEAIKKNPIFSDYYNKLNYTQNSEVNDKKRNNFLIKVSNFISQVKREIISDTEIKERTNEEQVLLYRTYQDILDSQNAMDFDDIILFAYNLFIEYPSVASLYSRSFQYIFIDEAQDMNNAQYKLLLAFTKGFHNNIMLAGDPDQSIFGFNGSSANFMNEKFITDYNPTTFKLKDNYRSSIKVLKAANKIISGSNEIVNIAIEGIFEIYEAENEADEADWVCNKINELISVKEHDDIEGDIAYEKIAILARNRYVFNQLEEKLTRKEIPFYYKMSPGYLKFESDIMKNFDMAFRVKLNNRDTLHWDSLIQSLKVNSIETVDLNKLIKSVNDDLNKRILEIVNNLSDDGANLKNLLENFKEYIKKSQNIVNDNEKKMILDDIEELLKHWHNYAKKTDNKSLGQFKNSIALGQTHPLTQHKGITLSTVHTMKGQETDIVFIIGADDETFPDYRALKDEAAMKQEKNNLYVAFTRAKRFLYVSYPKRRTMPWGDIQGRRISRFLENIG